jgi:hypothetical protein
LFKDLIKKVEDSNVENLTKELESAGVSFINVNTEEDLIKEYYINNKINLIDGEKEAIRLAWETENN